MAGGTPAVMVKWINGDLETLHGAESVSIGTGSAQVKMRAGRVRIIPLSSVQFLDVDAEILREEQTHVINNAT